MSQSSAFILYGIKNCDSVRKARAWLESRHIDYRFHDYRVEGLEADLLADFVSRLGVEALLNQRSTSWRQLSEAQKADMNADKAMQLMLELPTLIKRPILDRGGQLLVGFSPELYQTLL